MVGLVMSICNLNSKVVFIHNPKTAGTSMEHKEFIGGGGHQNIEYFKRAFELSFRGLPKWEEMFKFGFVRNPYSRFASAVTSHYIGEEGKKENNLDYPLTAEGFTQFAIDNQEVIKNVEWPRWPHLVPQYKYLCMASDGSKGLGWKQIPVIAVDFVGRFENLQEDWKYVCDKVRVSNELTHWRKNKFQDYDSIYTRRAKHIVRGIYDKDFKIFNYD